MITILILTEKLSTNEKIAASIVGGFSEGITIVSTTEPDEAESVYRSEKQTVDVFILQINMKKKSGNKIAEQIRRIRKYQKTPILFITPLSYNMVGFHPLATFKSYENHNYISLPIERLDVQGKLGLYIDKILAAQSDFEDEKVIFLEHETGQTFVSVKDILYAEVRHKVTTLYCSGESYVLKRMTLHGLLETVRNEDFLQCHKSFAVSIPQIVAINTDGRRNWKAMLPSGESCPISQTFYAEVRERFMGYGRKDA